MNNKHYFLLFSNCKLVKGASQSTICDLQRGCYFIIPNRMADVITDLERTNFISFFNKNKGLKKKVINSFLKYLSKNDLGHFCTNPIEFPEIDTTFITPNKLEDCIIELSDLTYKKMPSILNSLMKLGCVKLEIRSYSFFPLEKLSLILELIASTPIRSVDIYLKYCATLNAKKYLDFYLKHPILELFIIHSAKKNNFNVNKGKIVFTKTNIISSNFCGLISKELFMINLPLYLEGLNHNTCLNRKISISENGQIKNCPSMSISFGNIKFNSIESILKNKGIQKNWDISKSQITVCKDCEFRFICTECRAFIEDPEDLYSKPLKCGYDPYLKQWEEWSRSPLKQKGITYYKLTKMQ